MSGLVSVGASGFNTQKSFYLSGFLKLSVIAQSKRMYMLSTKTMKTHNAKQTID